MLLPVLFLLLRFLLGFQLTPKHWDVLESFKAEPEKTWFIFACAILNQCTSASDVVQVAQCFSAESIKEAAADSDLLQSAALVFHRLPKTVASQLSTAELLRILQHPSCKLDSLENIDAAAFDSIAVTRAVLEIHERTMPAEKFFTRLNLAQFLAITSQYHIGTAEFLNCIAETKADGWEQLLRQVPIGYARRALASGDAKFSKQVLAILLDEHIVLSKLPEDKATGPTAQDRLVMKQNAFLFVLAIILWYFLY